MAIQFLVHYVKKLLLQALVMAPNMLAELTKHLEQMGVIDKVFSRVVADPMLDDINNIETDWLLILVSVALMDFSFNYSATIR